MPPGIEHDHAGSESEEFWFLSPFPETINPPVDGTRKVFSKTRGSDMGILRKAVSMEILLGSGSGTVRKPRTCFEVGWSAEGKRDAGISTGLFDD